jgi:hypothetical protein
MLSSFQQRHSVPLLSEPESNGHAEYTAAEHCPVILVT